MKLKPLVYLWAVALVLPLAFPYESGAGAAASRCQNSSFVINDPIEVKRVFQKINFKKPLALVDIDNPSSLSNSAPLFHHYEFVGVVASGGLKPIMNELRLGSEEDLVRYLTGKKYLFIVLGGLAPLLPLSKWPDQKDALLVNGAVEKNLHPKKDIADFDSLIPLAKVLTGKLTKQGEEEEHAANVALHNVAATVSGNIKNLAKVIGFNYHGINF